MDLTSILIGLAETVAAPLVKQVLADKFGPGSGPLVDAVTKSIANSAGVGVEQLPDLAAQHPETVKDAIVATEALAPELVGLYSAGLAGQFALLQTESAEGPLQSGWRWGWMYLLGLFWLWLVLLRPLLNATLLAFGSKIAVEAFDIGVLMTLTSWFIALYMGGHTIKELGANAMEAVKSLKGDPK